MGKPVHNSKSRGKSPKNLVEAKSPKRRKPITSFTNLDFDTSTEDLQNRIRKLKEAVRQTKESLTSNTLNSKTKRKRVKGKKRRRRPNNNQLLEKNNANEQLTIVYPENAASSQPTLGKDTKNSDTTRSRGRVRGRIVKHRINNIKKQLNTKIIEENDRSSGRPSRFKVKNIIEEIEEKDKKNIEK